MTGRSGYSLAAAAAAGMVLASAGSADAGCAGDFDSATNVMAGQTVTLNPGGGADDPIDEVLVVFTNGSDSEPATITACEVAMDIHMGVLGYDVIDLTLTVEVTFEQNDPDNVDTYVARVMMPFDLADLPRGATPEATELTWFNQSAWVLGVSGNTVNSPGFAETVGDRFTVVGTSQPTEFSDEVGDFGVFWHEVDLRGFAWANIDHASDFSPGSPLCWSDVDGDGIVDLDDLLQILGMFGQTCDDPPVGCKGDIFFDGVIDCLDLALVLVYFGGTCFLPPDVAAIHHSVASVDNSAGAGDFPAGFDYRTWDILVQVDPDDIDDSWTTTMMTAEINDFYGAIEFFNHIAGSCGPPTPALCPLFDALQFDTYVTEATDTDLCSAAVTGDPTFGCTETATLFEVKWIDGGIFPPPEPFDPPHAIARITLQVEDPDPCTGCHLDLDIIPSDSPSVDPILHTFEGTTTHRFGLSNVIPFSFDVIDKCAADINDNGAVGIKDFLQLLADWDMSHTPADLDRDGVVGIIDFLSLLSQWGPCP